MAFEKTFRGCKMLKAHSKVRQFLATESPSKIMKNAFYFTLKALLVLMTFNFFFFCGQFIENNFRNIFIEK